MRRAGYIYIHGARTAQAARQSLVVKNFDKNINFHIRRPLCFTGKTFVLTVRLIRGVETQFWYQNIPNLCTYPPGYFYLEKFFQIFVTTPAYAIAGLCFLIFVCQGAGAPRSTCYAGAGGRSAPHTFTNSSEFYLFGFFYFSLTIETIKSTTGTLD